MSSDSPPLASLAPAAPIRSRRTSLPSSDLPSTPAPRPRPVPSTLQTSPSYTSSIRSRHSLYGTEDRVVLDLGSRIWKYGFSGEGSPRGCQSVLDICAEDGAEGFWSLERGEGEGKEGEERLKRALRRVWFDELMADPKARKVIVVENAFLSAPVKAMIARVLFDNLRVPSLSFAPSHLLSVMAVGCVTGLVVDCGHLETTVLPIYAARPLYPYLVSTPVAGSRLNRRLRALLLRYASFVPPPSSLNSTSTPIITKVPAGLLSEAMIEEIKTRLCFVGDALPPSDDLSDLLNDDMETDDDPTGEQALLRRMERRYASRVTATTITFKVPSLHLPPVLSGVGRGWIQVPGWVRERAAEVLFEEGDEDARSITEVILESLLRLPLDLRKPLASSILLTGGTPLLPNFFPRLLSSLLSSLSPPAPAPPPPSTHPALSLRLSLLRSSPHFSSISPLIPHICILNNPSPKPHDSIPLHVDSGRAPGWSTGVLGWVGGSLAGSLKTGGEEVRREDWAREGGVRDWSRREAEG